MKQVVQPAGGGPVEVLDVPIPTIQPTQVLVRTEATLISIGTERAVTQLAQSSLVAKAKARPDLVRQVLVKAKNDGLADTLSSVRTRLAEDVELGYSGAGTIIEVGDQVRGLRPGMRVATAGGGYASHAEYQAVPELMCVPIPDDVRSDQAAFATVASIGLHGLRLADLSLGSSVVVVGLGLIGQLTTRMALAAGHRVFGIDVRPEPIEMAEAHGASGGIESGSVTTKEILEWTKGRGADAIIVTAGARQNSEAIQRCPDRCRDRATIVVVGDVGLDLDRNAFYEKELELKLARSYGPGRYDRSYEEWAVDYPLGHVRWTQQRNLETFLDLVGGGRVDVDDLISHRFPIAEAVDAYDLVASPAGAVGVVLDYDATEHDEAKAPRPASRPTRTAAPQIGILGAGLFVRATMLPALTAAGFDAPVHISSARGASAERLAEQFAGATTSTGHQDLIDDPAVDLVCIASPHKSHGDLVLAALGKGKHVYVEKPITIDESQMPSIRAALAADGAPQLYVGLNRRFSPMVIAARDAVAGDGPKHVIYRINAGALPAGHWYADRTQGGRLLGEVCHFIDASAALVSSGSVSPTAVTANAVNLDAHDSYTLLVEYSDGSTASIVYCADAFAGSSKEWIEVMGNGATAVVDNFRRLDVNGERVKIHRGKGHADGLRAFRRALVRGDRFDAGWAFESTEVAFAALRSAHEGRRVVLAENEGSEA